MKTNLSNLIKEEQQIIEDLSQVLQNILQKKNYLFSGLGIILYQTIDDIPVFPLRDSYDNLHLPAYGWSNIELMLKNISEKSSVYHDGFHLISADVSLTHVAQYFSPPIVKGLVTQNRNQFLGCRYRAALFGSCLKEVIATAVVSNSYGCRLFVDGLEIDLSQDS